MIKRVSSLNKIESKAKTEQAARIERAEKEAEREARKEAREKAQIERLNTELGPMPDYIVKAFMDLPLLEEQPKKTKKQQKEEAERAEKEAREERSRKYNEWLATLTVEELEDHYEILRLRADKRRIEELKAEREAEYARQCEEDRPFIRAFNRAMEYVIQGLDELRDIPDEEYYEEV